MSFETTRPKQARGEEESGLTVRADSADTDARTVEIVWSTGARVRRRGALPDDSGYGAFDEELSLNGDAVDLTRMSAGKVPFLDTHLRWDMGDVLGTVVEGTARIEGGVAVATVKFRDTEKADEVFRGILDGTVRNVSVGYRVDAYEVTREEGRVPLFVATRWTPMEVSMVPIGADGGAGVRNADESFPCTITLKGDAGMPKENAQTKSGAGVEGTRATDEGNTPESTVETKTRAAASPVNAADVVDVDSVRKAAVEAERRRVTEIGEAIRKAGLESSLADDLIGRGVEIDAARAIIIDKVAEVAEAATVRGARVEGGDSNDDPAVIRQRMGLALAHRCVGGDLADEAREYRGFAVSEMARELLEARGEKIRGLRGADLVQRALGTSDFPILLQETGDRVLLPAYEAAPQTYRAISRKITNRDFRAKALIRDGDFPTLLPVNEHGELKEGAMSESKETVTLKTVGRSIRLTREALINDDLGAFTELAQKAGQAAADYENATVWGIVTSNTVLSSDNKALFHADHNNLASSGAAISATTVGKGKEKLRTQTSLDGRTLNTTPSVIAVPAALETTVEQYLANIVVPTKSSDVVPASHKQLTPVVEALLDAASATAWYLFADPTRLAAIVYAYLEGQEGPQMRQNEVSLMGIKFDVVLDFAAAPVEYRAGWKNAGA